jgi:hypothetical protein
MNIENQVTSLELSKRLKDQAVKQTSYFKWEYGLDGHNEIFHSKDTSCGLEYCSAFTANELLELLPACIDTKQTQPFKFYSLKISKKNNNNPQYIVIYCYDENISTKNLCYDIYVSDKNLCNALAKMLIYLIENNLMELPK